MLFTYCAFKIKDPDILFQEKNYAQAIQYYIPAFDKQKNIKEKAKIAFQVAQCYKFNSNFKQSLIWYKKAYDLDYGPKALEQYAYALKQNEEYSAAALAFKALQDEVLDPATYRREQSICNMVANWNSDNKLWTFKVSPYDEINTKANEYGAHYDREGNIIITTDQLGVTGKNKYGWTGQFYSDIYIYTPKENSFTNITEKINTPDHEGSSCFNKSNSGLFFTRCINLKEEINYCQLFYAKHSKLDWKDAEWIDLNDVNCNNIHPAISDKDSILIFASDRKAGYGGYDLYQSKYNGKEWSIPENLGDVINTIGHEKFPVWDHDTLYFSSDYLPGLGGLDIFKTYKDANGKWQAPINLKKEINSSADDFSFHKDPAFISNDSVLSKGIFSSNRNFTNGDDIYYFELSKNKVIEKLMDREFQLKIFVEIHFTKALNYADTSSANLELDSVNIDDFKDAKTSRLNTGLNSYIKLQVLPNESYSFRISRKNYYNQLLEFQTLAKPILIKDSTVNLKFEVEMAPISTNQQFVLKDVFYDFDKWDIRPEAKIALDQLYQFLEANPKIKITLVSHTDCRGDDNYNLILSRKRAVSAINYLKEKGIDEFRLRANGVGETDPAINCNCANCSEAFHQLNRRTTFQIIN